MKPNLIDLVNLVGDPPTIPTVARKVIQVCSSDDCDMKLLDKLISSDPALASRILKIANSAFYGTLRSINTIKSAIVLIGIKTVKNFVVTASMKDVYKRFGLAENILWEHSIGAAIACNIIAKEFQCRTDVIEFAFIAGLLHDIGKLLMNNSMPDKYSDIIYEFYNNNTPFYIIEQDKLGFTHADVGSMVLKKWNFSADLERAIANHHRIQIVKELIDTQVMLALLIELADMACHFLGLGVKSPNPDIDFSINPLYQRWGIDDLMTAHLLERIQAAYNEEKGVFN